MPRQFAVDSLIYAGTQMANQPGRPPWRAAEIIEKVARSIRAGEQRPRSVAA